VEAEILLMHVTGSSRASLLTHPERPLLAAEARQYEELVGERVLGYPLPYLTGRTEFYGLEIEVTPDVMIPRPETEILVDLALEQRPLTIVDVCTGSGCIAIALASQLPETSCLGIDISPPALAVARRNAERHGLERSVQFIVGDLLDRRPGPVDLIVSNPPYVSADEWASLPPSILYHEPYQALNGGADGLEVIRRLLSQSEGLLRPGGGLLLEIGASQGEAVMEIAKTCFPDSRTSVRIRPDLAGRDRVLEVLT
jgi:release factor glutamine methyltransferase